MYGEGSLARGKTYYTFGQFARESVRRGIAAFVEKGVPDIVPFTPSHLLNEKRPKRILLLFAGGLGDAVTLGMVLPMVMRKYELSFDICCDRLKWEGVFRPMGMGGSRIPFPPDLETLSPYEAVLSDILQFYPSKDGLRHSPVTQLLQGFGLCDEPVTARYEIPHELRERTRLGPPRATRVGVNLDSHGHVKSYPPSLEEGLVRALRDSGMEVFLFGSRNSRDRIPGCDGVYDLRGKTTIQELAAFLEQMQLVLGVDSFIVHLSHLLEKPALLLLSTTSPASFSWHRHISCVSSGLDCSPCFALFDLCPKGHPECKAFWHESMSPEAIVKRLVDERENMLP